MAHRLAFSGPIRGRFLTRVLTSVMGVAALMGAIGMVSVASAQEQLPWGQSRPPQVITPDQAQGGGGAPVEREYLPPDSGSTSRTVPGGQYDPYAPRPLSPREQAAPRTYSDPEPYRDDRAGDRYDPRYEPRQDPRYDQGYDERYGRGEDRLPPVDDGTYSPNEITSAGHKFFGSISRGLAEVVEYAFSNYGRPNGYILGQEASGAYVAGLRYGEGRLYTKDAGQHPVYWQGPSIGIDFGADGAKTMILVYNIRSPEDIYGRFGGVDGSAYLVGGVGITLQKRNDVLLAPIRAGVGLRLGANVGYLKYTRHPTWNPF